MTLHRKHLLLLVGFAFLFVPKGFSQDPSGNEFLQRCKDAADMAATPRALANPTESFAAGWCVGYMAGFLGGNIAQAVPARTDEAQICFPSDLEPGQALKIVVGSMADNALRLRQPAWHAVHLTLKAAFPCVKN